MMPKRLKSNFKYAWVNLLYFAVCAVMLYGGMVVLPEVLGNGEPGKAALIAIWIVLALGGSAGYLLNFMLKWQWVIVDQERILVRCALFEIKAIPRSEIKRCWVCKHCLMTTVMRNWNLYRGCIVIDTGISRRNHQVEDGYCRKKQKYIIFPDTVENRLVLRECGIVVEK